MVQTLIALVVLAVVVGGVFLLVWLADAKRAEQIEHDPERLDTDTDANDPDTHSRDRRL